MIIVVGAAWPLLSLQRRWRIVESRWSFLISKAGTHSAVGARIEFAARDMRSWLQAMGMRWIPVDGWAERGGSFATGHGNNGPQIAVRLHILARQSLSGIRTNLQRFFAIEYCVPTAL